MSVITVPVLVLGALLGAAPAAPPAPTKPPHQVAYLEPTKPEQAHIAEKMKQERVLEDAVEMLSIIRLPKLLTLRAETCGESNAWYDSETHVLTFCYELVDDFLKMAQRSGHFELTQDQAVVGSVLFVGVHEPTH